MKDNLTPHYQIRISMSHFKWL